MGLADELWNDPLMKRWVRSLKPDKPDSITEPWQVFGEMRATAYNILRNPDMYVDRSLKREALARTILQAPPFLWNDSILRTALASPLPSHTIPDKLLSFPVMYWSFEDSFTILDWDAQGSEFVVDSMLIAEHLAGYDAILFLFGALHDNGAVGVVSIDYGKQYPGDILPDSPADMILKMQSFLNSKYVVAEKRRLSRPQIRHEFVDYAGILPNPPAPEVCIINLRTPQYTGQRPERREDDGTAPVWSHRWWVRAHHQRYHTNDGDVVRWIAAHMKPQAPEYEDLPFHHPLYHVRQ